MDYLLNARDHELTAALRGRFTAADATMFREMLQQIRGCDCRSAVIDLSGVDFADSAALSLMILAHREIGKAGKQFGLRGLNGQVKRVFELTQLDAILPVVA